MAVIVGPESFANRWMAENVREAFQTIGEQCIFLKMYHAFVDDPDEETPNPFPRCPRCWDPFYRESTDKACPVCSGTGISPDTTSGGIKQFGRAWCVITDNTNHQEILHKYGQWDQDDREIQLEGGIEPVDHDFLVRVHRWSSDSRPLELGPRYEIDNPSPVSLRSGNQYAQDYLDNSIGYKFRAKLLRNFNPIATFHFPPDQRIPRFFANG